MLTKVIDFARSFITFVTPDRSNTARIQVECACVLAAPEPQEYFLVASCKSEDVYVADGLFRQPNYDFCAIFSSDRYAIVRAYANSELGGYEIGEVAQRFDELKMHIARAQGQVCASEKEIIEATLANKPLVGRTTLSGESSGLEATLEYPIKTMNVCSEKNVYQVDTGPVVFPELGQRDQDGIERLTLAFVAFNRIDRAEFVLQVPTPVHAAYDVRTPHYSQVRKVASTNTIIALD